MGSSVRLEVEEVGGLCERLLDDGVTGGVARDGVVGEGVIGEGVIGEGEVAIEEAELMPRGLRACFLARTVPCGTVTASVVADTGFFFLFFADGWESASDFVSSFRALFFPPPFLGCEASKGGLELGRVISVAR